MRASDDGCMDRYMHVQGKVVCEYSKHKGWQLASTMRWWERWDRQAESIQKVESVNW